MAYEVSEKIQKTLNTLTADPKVIKTAYTINELSYVEAMAGHEPDSTQFAVESQSDVRKAVFSVLAANDWPLIGVETMGVNLEEIFISLVDRPDGKQPGRRITVPKANQKAGE